LKIKLVVILSLLVISVAFSQSIPKLLSSKYNTFFTEVDDELWVASAGHGWNRFNGLNTENFAFSDTLSGLKGSYIQSKLYQDDKNRLWSSTYEYITVWDNTKNNFENIKIQNLNGNKIDIGYHVFNIDNAAKILYLRCKDQLYFFNTESRKINLHLGQTIANSYCVWKDTIAGAPWMNGEGFELWTFNKTKWIKNTITDHECPELGSCRVTKILHFRNSIWLLTDKGLVHYNPKYPNTSKLYSYQNIRNSMIDADTLGNYILIGTDTQGLLLFDTQQNKFVTNYFSPYNRIDYVFVDRYNQIITSHANEGMTFSYLHQHLYPNIKFRPKSEWQKFENSNGFNFLIDEENGIVIRKNGVIRKFTVGSKQLPLPSIIDAVVLNDHEILVFGRFEYLKYDWIKNTFSPLKIKGLTQFQNVTSSDSEIYIIGDNSLIVLNKATLNNIPKNISSKYNGVMQKACYISDTLTTYSSSSSRYIIEKSGKDTIFDLGAFVYNATYINQLQQHFIATQNGVSRLEKNFKITNLTSNHPILHRKSSEQVKFYNSWIYVNADKLFYRLHTRSGEIQIFDRLKFAGKPLFYIAHDTIFFAMENVTAISINDAFAKKKTTPLHLTTFEVNQKKTSLSITKFSYEENTFSWTYNIHHQLLADQCKVTYRLLPIDTSWVSVDNGKSFTYKFLPPGNYKLEVKGMYADGQWSNIATYEFSISPIWFLQTWFIFFCILSILASSYIFYKWRIRQIKHKYTIQTEISNLQRSALQAQMNPHFIFNCLNSIQNFIMQNEKLEAMDYLNRFANLIRQNLEASTSNTILLSDELDMLKNYIELEQMRFNHAFDYVINIGDKLDIGSTFIPPLLIQPFVENAILHGVAGIEQRGKIQIDISKEHQYLYIHIIDNGRGIIDNQKDKMHKSHAMKITSQRLDYINSAKDKLYNINTTSSEKGTHITISVYLPDVVKS